MNLSADPTTPTAEGARDDDVAIEIRGVVKKYGSTRAVDDLSLTVPMGVVFALLGPNGAGKTTTIEMCEGFIKPTAGTIRVLGLDPHTHPQAVRSRVGMMLQGGGGYSGIRVRELLQLTASYHRNPLSPDWLIEVLGLTHVAKTPYRRLSGGQQQRLSLALALIGRPELVFLDEPTAGMDTQSRRLVWTLIEALRRDGVTVVLTTHLMDEVEALADIVAIIDRGRLVASGTPNEVAALSSGSGVRVCFDQVDVAALERHLGPLTWPGPREALVPGKPSPATIARIAQAAAEQDALIVSLNSTQDLESAFLDITGRAL